MWRCEHSDMSNKTLPKHKSKHSMANEKSTYTCSSEDGQENEKTLNSKTKLQPKTKTLNVD